MLFILGVFLFWENEVFLTKVNELEGKFYLKTSVVDAKYPKLNYSICIFHRNSFFGLLDKTE